MKQVSYPASQTGLGEVLFSKTRRQVIGLLFSNPNRSFYSNEIVRHAGVGTGSVHRELKKLAVSGLISVVLQGNQKHYQANKTSPVFTEIRGIVLKTFGLGDVLCAALAPLLARIELAFVFGSVARGTDTADSDIDIMVLSEQLSYADLITCLTPIEGQLGRSINPVLYAPSELKNKMNEGNAFLENIFAHPRILLTGSEDVVSRS